jgi:histidinol dehydrogenase
MATNIFKEKRADINKFLLKMRSRLGFGAEEENVVREIINNVNKDGDKAIIEYTKKFDGINITPKEFKLSKEAWEEGIKRIEPTLKEIIDITADRLERYYRKIAINSWFYHDEYGNLLGTKVTPLERVLVYAPGGKAIYPSSVLMGVIPAKVAGVKEIILTTPAKGGNIAPSVLYAAKKAGVSSVYVLGGAHAIAGFSFGTKTLPKVDKIIGPGNIYVATAKKLLFGVVDIDMVAGPSEVLVIFDETANLSHVALDMLSQLEHDEKAVAIAITCSRSAGIELEKVLVNEAKKTKRYNIIKKSLENSAIILANDLLEAVNIANEIAPEHLEVCTENPYELIPFIRNAGAVFIGKNTPEAIGDYIAGPNHILPTGGTARFFSPLSVEDFVKRTSIISFTDKGLKALGEKVSYFAKAEGLFAHSESVELRLKRLKDEI